MKKRTKNILVELLLAFFVLSNLLVFSTAYGFYGVNPPKEGKTTDSDPITKDWATTYEVKKEPLNFDALLEKK